MDDVRIRELRGFRVARLTGAHGAAFLAAATTLAPQLLERLQLAMDEAGLEACGPPLILYKPMRTPDRLRVHASLPVTEDAIAGRGFSIVDLPPVEQAVTVVHRGSMANVQESWDRALHWLRSRQHTHQLVGIRREMHLQRGPNPALWGTELQLPLSHAPARNDEETTTKPPTSGGRPP